MIRILSSACHLQICIGRLEPFKRAATRIIASRNAKIRNFTTVTDNKIKKRTVIELTASFDCLLGFRQYARDDRFSSDDDGMQADGRERSQRTPRALRRSPCIFVILNLLAISGGIFEMMAEYFRQSCRA